jgi:hypothetical protein
VPTLWGGGPGARPEGAPPAEEPQAKEPRAGPPRRPRPCQRIKKKWRGTSGRSPIGISSDRSLPYKQTWLPCLAHGPCRVKYSLYVRCDFH